MNELTNEQEDFILESQLEMLREKRELNTQPREVKWKK